MAGKDPGMRRKWRGTLAENHPERLRAQNRSLFGFAFLSFCSLVPVVYIYVWYARDKQTNRWYTFFMSQSMALCSDQFGFSCHGARPILQPIRFSTPGQILSKSPKLQHVKNYESCPTKVSCMSRLSHLSRLSCLSVLNAALIALNDEL